MSKVFTAYRYIVFVLFIVCNIVLCAVSAWNLSVALAVQSASSIQVDAVLISVGGVALLFMLPVIFVDVLRKDSVICRVWFECFWVFLFCLLELGAAAAVTTTMTMSGMNCVISDVDGVLTVGSCVSNTLKLAFSWAAAALMLFYLLTLTALALHSQRDDPLVWKSAVSEFDWFGMLTPLDSAPSSPKAVVVDAPAGAMSKTKRRTLQLLASTLPKTEFAQRMFVSRDVEKQTQGDARPSIDGLPTPIVAMPRHGGTPRPSLEQAKPAWTPRQLQLSTNSALPPVVQSPRNAVAPRSPTPVLAESGDAGAASPRGAAPAPTPQAVQSPAGGRREFKKRVLRLHRPPSLDLSRIANSYRSALPNGA